MTSLLRDLGFALRTLVRQPAFSITSLLTLILALAPAILVFSLLQEVVLRPLPFQDTERLVRIWEVHPTSGHFTTSDPNFLDWRQRQESFQVLVAYRERRMNLERETGLEQIAVTATTPELFDLLGRTDAAQGRTLRASDQVSPGVIPGVVVSHDLARRMGAAAAPGTLLTLDGERYPVLGVMPADFDFPAGTELWLPYSPDPDSDRDDHWLATLGRLTPGIGIEQARNEMSRIAQGLSATYPASNEGWGISLEPFSEWLIPASLRRAMTLLQIAAVLVFLLAAANLVNLFAARLSARRRELALRTCLGASRGRLAGQRITEAAALGVPGAGGGLLLATWQLPAVIALAPDGIPRLDAATLDRSAFAFTGVVVLFAVILLGLASGSFSDSDALRGLRGGRATPRKTRTLRRGLVTFQIGLGTAVLVLAGLLTTSSFRLGEVDPGFRSHNIWVGEVSLAATQGREDVLERALERLRLRPEVADAAATSTPPLAASFAFVNDVTPADRADEVTSGGLFQVGWRSVSPGFFKTLDIPLLEGRTFIPEDGRDGLKPAVVSHSFAERLWPGESSALDRRFFFGGTDGEPWTVVGVVGDIRDLNLEDRPQPLMYLPYRRAPLPSLALVVKTETPASPVELIRSELQRVDVTIPRIELEALAAIAIRSTQRQRFYARLLVWLSVLATALAASGVYGLMAFEAAQSRRATGIRMALGATAATVRAGILRQILARAVPGVAAGTALAVAGSYAWRDLLFRTSPTEPWVLLLAGATMAATAALAAWLPAHRLSRIDPAAVLAADG